jgi:hypothetical protein
MRIFLFIGCILSVVLSAKAQTTTSGSFKDFGMQKQDTILHLNRTSLSSSNKTSLFYADFRKSFNIECSLKCNTLVTEQVFLCKEGNKGELFADLSIGYDPTLMRIFAELKDSKGDLHRVHAGPKVETGVWYGVKVEAEFKEKSNMTDLTLTVSGPGNVVAVEKLAYKGSALVYNVTPWTIGRGFPGGFPNSLQVLNGDIYGVAIKGTGFAHKTGSNPLFSDRLTADPACTVIGDRIYAYVGEDQAGVGGWFNMPHWVAYSSEDMKKWECHGVVLKAGDFPHANSRGAWAAQVVEKDGKYYYYVTLDDNRNGKHMLNVAVSDSPTGPFVPARKDDTPLITDDMTKDSHRSNSDIDPTVLIDDDGTPWMAWGNGDCYLVRLKPNMIELDGEIRHLGLRNYSEGPWLFKRKGLYYNVYAADAPGVQAEQIAYSTASNIEGPWTYRGLLTGAAKYGFTIHPSVNEFKGKWYFFYHDGSYMFNGEPGGDCRRQVCVEEMKFNKDGSIRPIVLTESGIAK